MGNQHPRTEIVLPGTTTSQLRSWATNVESENPVHRTPSPYLDGRDVGDIDLLITDYPFMGVEMTFVNGDGEPIYGLGIFADVPTAAEQEEME